MKCWLICRIYYKKCILPTEPVIYNRQELSVIACLKSMNFFDSGNGTIMIMIDENNIKKLLSSIDITGGGWAYIVDDNLNIISSVGEIDPSIEPVVTEYSKNNDFMRKKINNKELFITNVVSQKHGLRFIAVQHYEVIVAKLAYIKDLVSILTIVTISLGLLVACYMANWNMKPLKNVLNKIRLILGDKGPSDRNEFDCILKAVSGLTSNNKLLQEEIREQKILLKASFFSRLLNGEFLKEDDIRNFEERIGIKIEAQYYVVCIIRFLNNINDNFEVEPDDNDNINFLVKRLLQSDMEVFLKNSQVHQDIYFYNVDAEKLAVIFAFNCNKDKSEEQLAVIVRNFWKNLNKYGPNQDIIAVGKMHDSIMDISKSYFEALKALGDSLWNDTKGVVWFKETCAGYTNYYFPEEVERRLLNLTRAGDKQEVEKLLKDILNVNLSKRKLSAQMVRLFIYNMLGTLIKLKDKVSSIYEEFDSDVEELLSKYETSGLEMFNSLVKIFYNICDKVNEHKLSHNTGLKKQILEFIRNNYMDNNLSLTMIAEEFGLSKI